MKKCLFVIVACLFVFSFSEAREAQEKWICYAQGKVSFGPPVGDMWQTTVGRGDSEMQATSNAQQACFSQGLQMCMVNSCHQVN